MMLSQSQIIRNWVSYTGVYWALLVPIYASQVYLFYSGTLYRVTVLQALAISLQDIAIWMALGATVFLLYHQYAKHFTKLKPVSLFLCIGLALTVIHVLIDASINVGYSLLVGTGFGVKSFIVHVGVDKLIHNACLALLLLMSLNIVKGKMTMRNVESNPADSTEVSTDIIQHSEPQEFLFVQENRTTTRIHFADIDYFESAGNYCCIHHKGSTSIIRRSLSDIMLLLPNSMFVRIHRSKIVNVRQIRMFESKSHGDGELTLNNNAVLRVSRRYRKELVQLLT